MKGLTWYPAPPTDRSERCSRVRASTIALLAGPSWRTPLPFTCRQHSIEHAGSATQWEAKLGQYVHNNSTGIKTVPVLQHQAGERALAGLLQCPWLLFEAVPAQTLAAQMRFALLVAPAAHKVSIAGSTPSLGVLHQYEDLPCSPVDLMRRSLHWPI